MIPLVMALGVAAIIALELWRRALGARVPHWLTAILVAAYIAIAGGASFTWWKLHATWNAIGDTNPADTHAALANGIARAMSGTVVALAAAIVATALLVWASLRRAR